MDAPLDDAKANSTRIAARGQGATPALVQTQATDPEAMPAAVRRQFVQVGRSYYFPDGARAFTDHGRRLTTPSENTEVIRSLVTIAQARGWRAITVRGTERFRKEAWFAARQTGLEVKGYTPTEFEQGRLARAVARRVAADDEKTAEPTTRKRTGEAGTRDPADSSSAPAAQTARRGLMTGRLLDHGRAPYRHDPREPVSYFVKIETGRGERTLWGVDFERAFRESLTRPQLGDEVGLRAIRQEAVTVKARAHNAAGEIVGEQPLDTHRNRWIVEKRSFFEARAKAAQVLRNPTTAAGDAVKVHPELTGTYLYLRGAEEIARQRIRDPQDQRSFVATIRRSLADAVARGEPLPPVRLRERDASDRTQPHASRTARPLARTPAPARE